MIKYLANALIGGDGQIEKRNMSWNMIGSFLYALASMVLTIAVIQIVGEDEGGIFSFAYSTFGQHMFMVAYFGIRPFQITDTRRRFTFGEYLRLRLMTCGDQPGLCLCQGGDGIFDGSVQGDRRFRGRL